MLTVRHNQHGFTLIELMVGVVIMGILLSIAIPNFQTWMVNSQIRNAAESIANGLQRARAEAVSRNTNVAFSLAMASPTDSSWNVYSITPASGIDSRTSAEGSKSVSLTVTPPVTAPNVPTVTFNSFGIALTSNPGTVVPATGATVSPTPFTTVDVNATGGTRPLRIDILSPGGSIRMCDPSLSPNSSPSAC